MFRKMGLLDLVPKKRQLFWRFSKRRYYSVKVFCTFSFVISSRTLSLSSRLSSIAKFIKVILKASPFLFVGRRLGARSKRTGRVKTISKMRKHMLIQAEGEEAADAAVRCFPPPRGGVGRVRTHTHQRPPPRCDFHPPRRSRF